MRYRYSTLSFYGPWRDSRAQAERDALQARQATRDRKGHAKIVLSSWTTIEEDVGSA